MQSSLPLRTTLILSVLASDGLRALQQTKLMGHAHTFMHVHTYAETHSTYMHTHAHMHI